MLLEKKNKQNCITNQAILWLLALLFAYSLLVNIFLSFVTNSSNYQLYGLIQSLSCQSNGHKTNLVDKKMVECSIIKQCQFCVVVTNFYDWLIIFVFQSKIDSFIDHNIQTKEFIPELKPPNIFILFKRNNILNTTRYEYNNNS